MCWRCFLLRFGFRLGQRLRCSNVSALSSASLAVRRLLHRSVLWRLCRRTGLLPQAGLLCRLCCPVTLVCFLVRPAQRQGRPRLIAHRRLSCPVTPICFLARPAQRQGRPRLIAHRRLSCGVLRVVALCRWFRPHVLVLFFTAFWFPARAARRWSRVV